MQVSSHRTSFQTFIYLFVGWLVGLFEIKFPWEAEADKGSLTIESPPLTDRRVSGRVVPTRRLEECPAARDTKRRQAGLMRPREEPSAPGLRRRMAAAPYTPDRGIPSRLKVRL